MFPELKCTKEDWDRLLYLRSRWFDLLDVTDGRDLEVAEDVFDVLCHYYSAPDRHYHSLEHIWYLLKSQETYFPDMEPAGILAIFWHDVIYIPGCPYSEQMSADMMSTYMTGLIGKWTIMEAHDIILDTKDHSAPSGELSAMVCDLDLQGLGGPPGAYDRNTEKIRKEFGRYSDEDWAGGRRLFLKERILRPHTYHTIEIEQDFEEQAKINMTRELESYEDVQ